MAGTDIRYPPPGPDHHALTGTFAPDFTLHTDQGTTTVADLMHTARPILLDLADRADLRETARDWQHRINIHTAETDHRPADALLIRPDAPPATTHRPACPRPCWPTLAAGPTWSPWAGTPATTRPVRDHGPIPAAAARSIDLPRHRRRRSPQPSGDGPQRPSRGQAARDLLPLGQAQPQLRSSSRRRTDPARTASDGPAPSRDAGASAATAPSLPAQTANGPRPHPPRPRSTPFSSSTPPDLYQIEEFSSVVTTP
jgi:hypothetical protein